MGTFEQVDWHGLVATARSLPLDRVATALGYRRDLRDKARWKRPGSVLSINGEKYFDHMSGTGGGGAISLVMHADGGGFRDAVAFLSTQGLRFCSPHRRDGAAVPAGRRRLDLPARSEASWPEVRDHLVTERGIGGMLLQLCHARGRAGATRNRRRQATFRNRSRRCSRRWIMFRYRLTSSAVVEAWHRMAGLEPELKSLTEPIRVCEDTGRRQPHPKSQNL